MIGTVPKWFTISQIILQDRLVPCSRPTVMGGLCISVIVISSVWNMTLLHHQFYYISYYYDISKKAGMNISNRTFSLGGLAPSELTHSVRAVRVTTVANCSAPGINTRYRVPYHPPIKVSLVRPAWPVSYFKWILWRCGVRWTYLGMGSLGRHLHSDCNAMCDAVKITPRIPATCA